MFVAAAVVLGLSIYSPLQALLLVLREPGVLTSTGSGPVFYTSRLGEAGLIIVQGPDFGAVFNSLGVALASALVSSLMAAVIVAMAYLYSYARLILVILLPVSLLNFPFVEAYVVKRILSVDYGLPGLLSRHLPLVVVPRGLLGVTIYETAAVLPYAVAVVAAAGLSTPREEVEAAIQLGARGLRLVMLLVSLYRPAVVTALLFGAILVLDDVGGPLVFSDDPLARGLLSYRAYLYFISSATGEVNSSGLGYTLLLLLVSLPFIAASVYMYRRLAERTTSSGPARPLRPRGFLAAALVTALMLPSLAMRVFSALYAFSNQWLRSIFPHIGLQPWHELLRHPDLLRGALNSSVYAAVVTGAALVIIPYIGWQVSHSRNMFSAAAMVIFTIPALVPGLVIAYGLYAAFAGRGFILDPLLSPIPLLLLGYYTRRSPLLFHASAAASKGLPASLFEAARGLGAGTVRAYFASVAPLLLRGIAAAAAYMSLSVAGEVSLSITLGGLAGAEGFHHPAPLMYLVASYMGYSGLRYASLCAAAMLLTYWLTLVLVSLVLSLYLFLSRKSYR